MRQRKVRTQVVRWNLRFRDIANVLETLIIGKYLSKNNVVFSNVADRSAIRTRTVKTCPTRAF